MTAKMAACSAYVTRSSAIAEKLFIAPLESRPLSDAVQSGPSPSGSETRCESESGSDLAPDQRLVTLLNL